MGDQIETVASFKARQRLIPKGTFVQAFPHPFLVEQQHAADGRPGTSAAFFTLQMEAIKPDTAAGQSQDGATSTRVYRVTKREGTAFPSMTTIGRTPQNDIVIDVQEVSKLHAYFTRNATSGAYSFTDAGSTNGTNVNGWPLKPKVGVEIQDGDAVSIADKIHLTFYSAESFYDMLGETAE